MNVSTLSHKVITGDSNNENAPAVMLQRESCQHATRLEACPMLAISERFGRGPIAPGLYRQLQTGRILFVDSAIGKLNMVNRNPVNMPKEMLSRRASALAILFVCLCAVGCATRESLPDSVAAEALLGTWKVDLRPTPQAEPYYQQFVVTSVEGNAFTGTFYGAPVSQARINTDWGKVRIAFVTADGSGPYNHSAVLEGSRLEGLSNSTGRDFLSYWSAVKQ